jgi:iron(III) transport system substrate-binding protein
MPNIAVRSRRFTLLPALVALLVAAGAASCSQGGSGELIVYSGRNQNLIGPLLEQFAEESGIDIRVKYADTGETLATLLEEGDATRADVFISQDAGALGELTQRGRLQALPDELVDLVDPRFRDDDRRWVGVTGRVRVISYNTDLVDVSELPATTLDVIDDEWRGKVGFPPSNASFIAFVGALRQEIGDDRTREFLEGLRDSGAKRYDNNILVLNAIARGEIELGLVNHYYLYAELKEQGDAPVANHYPGQGSGAEGTLVNVSGAGILEGTDRQEEALEFMRFLLSEDAQNFFRDETAEYPMREGIDPIAELPPLADLRTLDVPLTTIGRDLEGTIEMIKDVGLS